MSTPEELAYAAGFVDADGYVSLAQIQKGKFRVPYVQVTNADSDIIWFFQLNFGGRARKRRTVNPFQNDLYEWTLTYDAALDFLRAIRPFMQHQKKTERIDLIMADYKRLTPRNGKYTEEMRAEKIAFENRVMGIKMRGS